MAESDTQIGRRVLIVEDESTISMFIEDVLIDLGYEVVGIAATLPDALKLAQDTPCDVAILDVNLNGTQTFDVAAVLHDKGTPFIFSTGYGTAIIPEPFNRAPVLQKPFMQKDLEAVLQTAKPLVT